MGRTVVRPSQIEDALTDADIASANKDGADGTPCMRSLGTGAGQAAKGSTTAPLSSPTFTGTPAAPTAAQGTSNTQIATTAFVNAEIAADAVLSGGKSGGQEIIGGTAAGENVALVPNSDFPGVAGTSFIYGQVAFGTVLSPAQITADQNNYSPTGFTGASVVRLNLDANRTITGLDSNTLSFGGALKLLINISSFNLTLPHESTSSSASNRMKFSGNVDRVLKPNDSILLILDDSTARWRDVVNPVMQVHTFPSIASEPTGQDGRVHVYAKEYATDDDRLYIRTLLGDVIIGAGSIEAGIVTGLAAGGGLYIAGALAGNSEVVFGDAVSYQNTISPASITATQNNYAPTGHTSAVIIRAEGDAHGRIINGISAGSGSQGRILVLMNKGTKNLLLSHESASATAANRIICPNNRNLTVLGGQNVYFIYDATSARYRVISTSTIPFPKLYREGFKWSRNATDTANDVDVVAGRCRDSTDAYDIVLDTTLTKRLDAAWAVGNNQGGLDTGARANNTWYFIHAIARSDTGVVDILLSTSAGAPTMPAGYDFRRLIGAIRTGASLLSQVKVYKVHTGYYVEYIDPATNGLDVDVTNCTTTRTTRTLPYLPPLASTVGTRFDANVSIDHASVQAAVYLSNPSCVDSAPSLTAAPLASIRMHSTTSEAIERLSLVATGDSQITDRSTTTTTTLKVQVLGYDWTGEF